MVGCDRSRKLPEIAHNSLRRWPKDSPSSFEVVVAQVGQDVEINIVRDKDLGVLLQSDFGEPRAQILGHISSPARPGFAENPER